MKTHILFLLLVMFSLTAFAQEKSAVLPLPDSLVMLLKENRKADEARVETLSAVIEYYFNNHNFEQGFPFVKEFVALSHDLKDNYYIALSEYYLGTYEFNTCQYFEAFTKLNDALIHTEMLRLNDRTRLLLGRIYLSKSAYYIKLNLFPESYETIQKGLEALNGTQSVVRPRLLNNLGYIYGALGNGERAIKVFKEAVKEEQKAEYYGNIAEAYNGKVCCDSAMIYADSALLVSISLSDSLVALHFKATAYALLREFDEAENLYEEGLSKIQFNQNNSFIMGSIIYQNLASVVAEKGDFQKALCLVEKAIVLSRDLQEDDRIAECIKLKSEILYAMNDYENSMVCMLEYDSIRDVVLAHQNRDRVSEIIHQQETRVLEQQYETERKTIRQRQQYILIIAIFVVVFVAVIVFFIVRDKRLKETLLKQELDLRNREITSKTMSQMQRNEVLNEVVEKLIHLENNPKGSGNSLPMVIRELKGMIDDGSKKDFDYYFVQVHPVFYAHLKEDFPDLTPNELRLCALVKANLNIKEIANLNNVSIDSVKSSRKRLRKSLGISDPNVDLTEFLSKY